MSRYFGRRRKTTKEKMHKELLDKRGVKHIKHYTTPVLSHPTVEERSKYTQELHVWSVGDRYYKLAHKHYGDSKYWWVIAHWNLKPTEGHLNLGDAVRFPGPINVVLNILKRNGGGY